MFDGSLFLLFLGVAILVAVLAFFFSGVKHALALALNSVIGYFALYAVQVYAPDTLVLHTWSVLLVAFFGIMGFALVLFLHGIGWAF